MCSTIYKSHILVQFNLSLPAVFHGRKTNDATQLLGEYNDNTNLKNKNVKQKLAGASVEASPLLTCVHSLWRYYTWQWKKRRKVIIRFTQVWTLPAETVKCLQDIPLVQHWYKRYWSHQLHLIRLNPYWLR